MVDGQIGLQQVVIQVTFKQEVVQIQHRIAEDRVADQLHNSAKVCIHQHH